MLDQCKLRVDFLARNRVLFQQRFEALQSDARAVELRFALLALADGLHQRHFKLARVDGGQQFTGLHQLAFLEQHFLHDTRYLRFDPHGRQRRDSAQRVQNDGDIGQLGGGDTDRGGRRAAPASGRAARPWLTGQSRRAGAGGFFAGRLRQIPGQPTDTGQRQHRHNAADDRCTATDARALGCVGRGGWHGSPDFL